MKKKPLTVVVTFVGEEDLETLLYRAWSGHVRHVLAEKYHVGL